MRQCKAEPIGECAKKTYGQPAKSYKSKTSFNIEVAFCRSVSIPGYGACEGASSYNYKEWDCVAINCKSVESWRQHD